MTLLFSETGRERLANIIRPGVLCAFDFDGTLAPIVAQPDRAHLPAELRDRLVELSRYAPVAIITGRSLEDIRTRAGFEADFMIGNHGMEGVPGWEQRGEHYEAMCRDWVNQLTHALQERNALHSGIWVENKRYSLSLHYRMAGDADRAEAELGEIIAGLSPAPRVVGGKYLFNLVPEDAAHKGAALEQLMRASGAATAIYVGDDVTDEDVFRLRRSDVLSVRVEHAPGSAAEFFVSSHEEVARLLDELIAMLRALEAKNWIQAVSAHPA